MEESKNDKKKRARDEWEDSDANSHNSKQGRVDSPESPRSNLARVDSAESFARSPQWVGAEPDPDDLDIHSPEARRIQDDLLNVLEETDAGNDIVPAIQDLDSVIKSFEEEILVPAPVLVQEVSSDSGDSQPDLRYLLGASDDELGLPPSFSSGDEQRIEVIDLDVDGPPANGFAEFVSLEDQIPCYDSFELGIGFDSESNYDSYGCNFSGNDFVALGCLFEHTETGREPSDVSEISWRPESLSAM